MRPLCSVGKPPYKINMGRTKWGKKSLAPGEQVYLTPAHIMDRYIDWYDPAPHPRPADFDGLKVDSWGDKAFVNPPWRMIRPWVEKALEEREKGCRVHMLLPATTTTRVFHDLIFPKGEVEWLRGDVPFTRGADSKILRLSACLVKFDPHRPPSDNGSPPPPSAPIF